jgi:hypothetical protein
MNLEDFDKPRPMDIEDFSSPTLSTANTTYKSDTNKALMSVAISGSTEGAEDQFENSIFELENFGISETMDKVSEEANMGVIESSEASLIEGVLDPKINDKTKLSMAVELDKLKGTPVSTQELYVENMVVSDGGEKNEEQAEVRAQMANYIKPYWDFTSQMQALTNSELEKLETSTLETIGEALEYWFLPFAYNTHSKNVLEGMLEATKSGKTSSYLNLITGGEANIDVKRILDSVPIEGKLELSRQYIDVLKDKNGIFITSDNQFAARQSIQNMLNGDYSEVDRWVDNFFGVIDTIPVLGGLFKAGKAIGRSADLSGKIVAGASGPVTVGKVALQTNAPKGFSMAEEAIDNPIAAEKLFDSNPADVAVEVLGPKPETVSKVVDPLPTHTPSGDKTVLEQANTSGQTQFTIEEKAIATAKIESDFQSVVGLKIRNEMTQISHKNGLQIKAVYTAGDTGFSSAKDAKDQVMFALKHRGIKDSEVTVLKRDETGYVKKDSGVWEKDVVEGTEELGDYIVQVDYKTKINQNDVSSWSGLDVKNNFMDRVGALVGTGKAGSFSRHLLDIHSMLNPILTMSANVAVDKGSLISRRITDLGEDFGNAFRKMDDAEKTKVDDYIKLANKEGFEHTPAQLVGEGFSSKAITALTSWRKTWDTVYWLENADLVKSLRAKGYQSLKVGGDDLLVRKSQMDFNNGRLYNPETGKVEAISKEEMRKLYSEGGYVGKSRTRLNIDGEGLENILVRNSTESYARALRETDQILEYRKGYYQVNYDAPVFIDKIVRDKNGKELYKVAVGMARDNVEAGLMRSKWAKADGVSDEDYGNIRLNKNNDRISSDDHFDMQVASGRDSQKVRGQRLQETTQPITGGLDGSLVQDPIDALTHAARSIGNRVPMRDWLETAKARFTSQYGDLLVEVNGQKSFPRSISDLGKVGDSTSSQVADARTTWEYINYMEGGYINSIDESLKGTMRAIGNIMGNSGYGKSQRAMEWMAGGRGITGTAKGTAFQLYLALNPLRQILVQSHQMVRLAAINPKYVLSGMMKDLAEVQGARLTGKSTELHKFIMDSGQIDSISRSNLLKDSMSEITHQSSQGALGKTKALAAKVTNASQKVGFEFGESNNVITSLLSFRNQAIKNGEDITDQAVLDGIYAKARNYTYNMNKAGDMPYNQNAAGIVMQFLQVPHKAMTQTIFNRALTKRQKASALMFDTVMFGVPAYWAADKWFADVLPEDPVLNEALKNGIEGMMFNSMLNTISEEHSELDFTSLSATSAQGFGDLFVRITEEGLGGLITKSPSGQLVLGNNPRISNAIKNLAIFSGAMPEYTPMEFIKVVKGFAALASGMSNGFNARMALKTGQIVNSTGKLITDEVTTVEAVGMMFGLSPTQASQVYQTNQVGYEKTDAFKKDIDNWYREVKRQFALAGDNDPASSKVLEYFATAWLVFNDNEIEARKYVSGLISKDQKNGDIYMSQKLFKLSGILPPSEYRRVVDNSPMSDELKKTHYKIADQIENRESGED